MFGFREKPCQVLSADFALTTVAVTRSVPREVARWPSRASEQSIFLNAIGLPSPADRAAYLDEACRDDPGLRAELDALLAGARPTGRRHPRHTGPEAAGDRSRRVRSDGGIPGIERGRRGGAGRPVQAVGADRRRRHGHRLHGPADRAGQAPGGASRSSSRAWTRGR